MENMNAVSIPLVDMVSIIVGQAVAMNGEDFVVLATLEKIDKSIIDKAVLLKQEKESLVNAKRIKAKANKEIEEKYPNFRQRNILMSQDTSAISEMNNFIVKIRNISNSAENNGIPLEDIDWSI